MHRRHVFAVGLGVVAGCAASLLVLRWAGVEPSVLLRRAAGRPATLVEGLHQPDPSIGYALIPGASFRHRTPEFDVTYHVGEDGGRRVDGGRRAAPRVDVYGDSWTFGHGVEDDETFAAGLQSAWPTQHVRNRGVMGYGTVHAMLALERDLERDGPPALVIYAFNPIHVLRNHLRRSHVENVAGGRTPHYVVVEGRLEARGLVGAAGALDENAPGLIDAEWMRTELFVANMARLADGAGARFVVVLLDGPRRLAGWDEASTRLGRALEAAGIEVVDLNRPEDPSGVGRHYFSDDHPTAVWNRTMADAIAKALAPVAH